MAEQPFAGLDAKGLHVQRGPADKGARRAHGVDACQKPADPLQHVQIVQFRRPPPAARADAERKPVEMMQRAPFQHQGPDGGHLGGHQLGGKGVFFQNLGVAPALGAVKLGHHEGAVFQIHLINAVFVRAERLQAAVTKQSHTGQGVQNHIGGEGFKSVHALLSPAGPIQPSGRALPGW